MAETLSSRHRWCRPRAIEKIPSPATSSPRPPHFRGPVPTDLDGEGEAGVPRGPSRRVGPTGRRGFLGVGALVYRAFQTPSPQRPLLESRFPWGVAAHADDRTRDTGVVRPSRARPPPQRHTRNEGRDPRAREDRDLRTGSQAFRFPVTAPGEPAKRGGSLRDSSSLGNMLPSPD